MKMVWTCEICERYYDKENKAIKCESNHCYSAYMEFGDKITELAKKLYILGRSATTAEEKLVVLAKGLADASEKTRRTS